MFQITHYKNNQKILHQLPPVFLNCRRPPVKSKMAVEFPSSGAHGEQLAHGFPGERGLLSAAVAVRGSSFQAVGGETCWETRFDGMKRALSQRAPAGSQAGLAAQV